MSSIKWEVKTNILKLCIVCDKGNYLIPFVYEMVSRWLIPGQQLDLKTFVSKSVKQSTRIEAQVRLSSKEEEENVLRNLPFLEKEILLGTSSFYQAAKILEMRGLSLENKMSGIQEKILKLIRRFPKKFDYDLITQMQQFLIRSSDNFKKERTTSHMARIISTLYDFHKRLEKGKKEVFVKMKTEHLHTPFGEKKVEVFYLGLSGLSEHEVFEKRHLLKALGDVEVNKESFYQLGKHLFYIECDKVSEAWKKEVLTQVMGRIEHRMPSIFMPRNEEEIMRTLVTLSQQLKFTKDIPQMALHFEGQTNQELIFTIMIVRLKNKATWEALVEDRVFTIERQKTLGFLRKKIPKEAVVLRARLSREPFVREDYSVDVFAARLVLTQEVIKRLGEVRDYNGGIIAKQGENFSVLKTLLGKEGEKHPLFLQNFFHSIFPAHYGATCDPHLLKILFLFLLEKGEGIRTKKADDYLFIVIKEVPSTLWSTLRHTPKLVTAAGSNGVGMIYLETDEEKQKKLLNTLFKPALDI